MLIKFRKKSQITLPCRIAKRLELKTGDFLECLEHPSGILLIPQPDKREAVKKYAL